MHDPVGAQRKRELASLRRSAREVLDSYGLDSASLKLLSHFCNTTYLVQAEDGDRFVLHEYRFFDSSIPEDRRLDWIEAELWWLGKVRTGTGLWVPELVPAQNGRNVTVGIDDNGDGAIPCVLFRWIDGRFLSRGLRPRHLESVGQMTARLHNFSSTLSIPPNLCRGQVDRLDASTQREMVKAFAAARSAEAGALAEAAIDRVLEAKRVLGTSANTFGLIHADIHQKNYLFAGHQIALIDFGDCGFGCHLYDLAVTINELYRHPDPRSLRAALLAGYRMERRLSPKHEGLIDAFVLLRKLQDLSSFFANPDGPTLPAHILDQHLGEMRKMLAAG